MEGLPEFTKLGTEFREYIVQKTLNISSLEESYLVEDPNTGEFFVLTMLKKDMLLNWFRDHIVGAKDAKEADRMAFENFKKFDDNFQDRMGRMLTIETHPNIAKYHTVDFDLNRGQHFAIIEHVSGRPINQETEGMLPEYIMALAVQILRALDYIHDLGFLHLKLSPKNIYVMRKEKKWIAKLINAGLIVTAQDPYEAIQLGHPAYISPEMILKNKVDTRADLYTFAAVLYELLSGQKPFPKRHVKKSFSLQQMKYNIEHEELPVSISGIPEKLNNIILALLQKNPDDRVYRSANDLMHAILKIYPDADKDIQKSQKSLFFTLDTPIKNIIRKEGDMLQRENVMEDEDAIVLDNIADLKEE
ncbi:MAG: protein kinase [Syntrophaceae bacterium]|nr:protein kinase [Syntrophaceae bacterium]